MDPKFPPIEPDEHGMLDVGDGHHVYWERCGAGPKAALFLHGGPGSGCSPGARRHFDPAVYRVTLFDQRGCGRSTPLAELDADLSTQTTAHLVADIEKLRELHGVERWTVLGVSWGTTLALAYAEAHPDRIEALVLGLVMTTSHREVAWVTEDVGRLFPREWARFAAAVPRAPGQRLVDVYAEQLADPDPNVRDHAAREWCLWEDAHISLSPGHGPSPAYEDAAFRLRFARLVTHYWRNAAFFEGEQLIDDIGKLEGIPAVLIHGVFDVSSPIETAWRLSQRWKSSELVVLRDAGHGNGASFPHAIVSALNPFAALR